ncbi:cysteine protease StiP family protein [Frischella perrara]|uniref:cysteine protease StiP family protein n=1 Tax=Frischella perrara TaxID=1267021 RepID=UPI0023F04E0D|nr:cysteine protease StiP family protein [Frischella perrara]
MINIEPFSGSYTYSDVQFLLKRVEMETTPVEIKEQLIQSGKKHYSEMISREDEPTSWHLDLFEKSIQQEGQRLAKEVLQLAIFLTQQIQTPIVLVSLVRAGVPLGVMLKRALKDLGKQTYHYGVSIIRDRGIDTVAMDWIENKHGKEGIVFVDGWTGKGAITNQLQQSLALRPGYQDKPKLIVLADPCGCAWASASDDDWLIPFGIMGAPVSGMISRSIWLNGDLHGCIQCNHLEKYDCSQYLADIVDQHRRQIDATTLPNVSFNPNKKHELFQISQQVIQHLAEKYNITNLNRIKPGIAEATRAVLRRIPDYVLVRNRNDPDVKLLIYLAESKNIKIIEDNKNLGNYRAITIIKKVSDE